MTRYNFRVEGAPYDILISFDSLTGYFGEVGEFHAGDEISFTGMLSMDRKIIKAMNISVNDGRMDIYKDDIPSYLQETVKGIVVICKRLDISGDCHYRCKQWA